MSKKILKKDYTIKQMKVFIKSSKGPTKAYWRGRLAGKKGRVKK